MVRALLVSIRDSEEEGLYNELMATLEKHGVAIQEYTETDNILTIGNLTLRPSDLRVLQGDIQIEFTYREFYLLYHLAKYPGTVFSKEHLYELLWKQYIVPNSKNSSVSALVSKVRKKLNRANNDTIYIQTIRDVGYRFNPSTEN